MAKTVIIVDSGVAYEVTINNGVATVAPLSPKANDAAQQDAAAMKGANCASLNSNTAALGIMATLVNI